MISGCISARGVDNIHTIVGIMVKYVHNDILKKMSKYHQDGNVIYLCSSRKTIANTMLEDASSISGP